MSPGFLGLHNAIILDTLLVLLMKAGVVLQTRTCGYFGLLHKYETDIYSKYRHVGIRIKLRGGWDVGKVYIFASNLFDIEMSQFTTRREQERERGS